MRDIDYRWRLHPDGTIVCFGPFGKIRIPGDN